MFPFMRFIVLAIFMVVGVSLPLHAQTSTYEIDTNRFGGDYDDISLSNPDPQACRSACLDDDKCKAWTYVKPGVQGPQAKCWLKDSVPNQSTNTATISGLISDRPTAIADNLEPSCSMAGTWTTNHQTLELQQSGRHIHGARLDAATGDHRGEVTATMSADRVSGNYTWNLPNPFGPVGELDWVMSTDCAEFTGTWSVDGTVRGNWNGTRLSEPVTSPDPDPSLSLASSSLEGIWQTSEGVWEPEQKDDTYYFGFYTSDEGRISGDLIGSVFEGYWIEDSSNQKCAYQRNGSDHWGGCALISTRI